MARKPASRTEYVTFDVFYKVKTDNGTMKLKGLYVGGVARF